MRLSARLLNKTVKLLPKSLLGRLLLVMTCGVLLAQGMSTLIWVHQLDADTEQNVRDVTKHMAFRVASTVQFFTSLPQAYRHVVLDQLRDMGGTRFFVTLNREEILINDIPDSRLKQVVIDEFRSALKRQLGSDEGIKIAFSHPDDLHVLNNRTLLVDLPERWGHHSLLVKPLAPPILVIQIPINETEWLYLATLMPDPYFLDKSSPLTLERGFSLLVMMGTVLALSFLVVRWLTRPLALLGRSAENFGKGGELEPVPEQGSREVMAAARAFNDMQQRIQRYLNDRERLFASISHDLKTPITRLRLRAELLENEADREAFCKDLEDLDMMVKGALQSVKDTDIHENRVEISLLELLRSLQANAAVAGHRMEVSGNELRPFVGKPLAIKRCLANLIDNAIYYGQCALVTLEDSEQWVRIRIQDRGPGIPEPLLDKVFDPYTRLTPDIGHPGSMGLGMGIARNIVHAHGGELRLRNLARGLEVTVTLPRQ